MRILKQLFCRHEYEEISLAHPITFFGIALWSMYNIRCRKCGKERVVDLNTLYKLCEGRRIK